MSVYLVDNVMTTQSSVDKNSPEWADRWPVFHKDGSVGWSSKEKFDSFMKSMLDGDENIKLLTDYRDQHRRDSKQHIEDRKEINKLRDQINSKKIKMADELKETRADMKREFYHVHEKLKALDAQWTHTHNNYQKAIVKKKRWW